jgi:1-acyl-sn-glycerol-3-phosphate acyltransferase
MSTRFYYLIGIASWPVVRGLFRLRASGLENLPASGFVLAGNHMSAFDPWAVGFPLWPRWRLRWMAKVELFRFPIATILHKGGAFPVRRGEGDQHAIEMAVRILRQGDVLVMFPEGTRREKGRHKRFQARPHTGSARIALAAGVPLVPAAISGTDRLSQLPSLRVAYGKPIAADDLDGLSRKQAAQVVTERLMAAIYALEDDLVRAA